MSDSYIRKASGSISYIGPDATRLYQARQIYSALVLYNRTKLKMTRGMNITRLLNAASLFTRVKYKVSEREHAIADMQRWIDAMYCAMPVVKDAAP